MESQNDSNIKQKQMAYYTYILTNSTNKVLYTGVTNNLIRRIYEHKNNLLDGFSKHYNVHKLVYYEILEDIENAITREKKIKNLSRAKKLDMITEFNSEWCDLYDNICK